MRSVYLPLFVLIGCLVGIFVGLTSPVLTGILKPFGDAYVRLMEVIVLPYLISSLILGLGRLTPATAVTLLRKSWPVYLFMWAVTFGLLAVAASTVQLVSPTAVVDFTSALSGNTGNVPSLVDLLIPDNLFEALSQDYIPSVVLMGVIFGVAVQQSKRPSELLDVLSTIRNACIRIWGWIVFLAPIGVCALFASSISSISFSSFTSLTMYVVVVSLSAAVMALWVFPMLLTVFFPLTYREVMAGLREAFIIAIVTSLSVASLPFIQQAVERFTSKLQGEERPNEKTEIIETTLSISYPLAQVGNFFILVFLLYAAFYFYLPIERQQLLELPIVTLLSGIGSPSSSIGAVTFMSEWLNLPSETTDLYVETMAISRYAQVIASVSAFAFVTTSVAFLFYGKIRFKLSALILTVAVSAAAFGGIWTLGRLDGTHAPLHSTISYLRAGLPENLQNLSNANSVSNVQTADQQPSQSTPETSYSNGIDRIETTGILRVGINPNVIPFSYINNDGQIVGYDVEMMYRFAQSMNVSLEFIEYDWQNLQEELKAQRFDIAVGGIYITDDRLDALTVSNPYFESQLALIVRTDQINNFRSRSAINQIADFTLAVFDDPVLIPLAKRTFPNAEIKIVKDYNNLENETDVSAALWTREQAKAQAISLEGYSAVVPEDIAGRFLFAYVMPPSSPGLAEYLNFWMRLTEENGVLRDMTRRWIEPAEDSVIN